MLVARLERERAEGEEALRVRARMLNVVGFGVERRLSIKARPCLPVAPAMRSVFGAGIAEEGLWRPKKVYESSIMVEGLFDEVSLGAGYESGRIDTVWIHGVRSLLYFQCPVVPYGKGEVSGHVVMVLAQIVRRISF